MPANLPPQYFEAEKVYRRARSPAEKIEALETMLAIMPKHKGTDHLRGELRARIAALQQQQERQGGGARLQPYVVHREGAGQAVLAGPPNVGKSQLLAALTHATPKVGEYPFTTQLPQPGMMEVENVQVQLVDLPPVVAGATPAWQRALIRQADLVLMLVDLHDDPLGELTLLQEELGAMRLLPVAPGALKEDEDSTLTVQLRGDGTAAVPGAIPKKALLVGTKADLAPPEHLELLRLEVGQRWPLLPVASTIGSGLEALRAAILAALDVIRVYTKPPGRPADRRKPFVLRRGSTVHDLADAIHHQLRDKLRYAVLWGDSGKYAGQRVGGQHVLQDQDVVELYER
jgi:ribosome-interacting GTPase 1